MIKSYLAHLELRIQAISHLLGNVSDLKEPLLKDIREGVNEVVSKLHKDNARKCTSPSPSLAYQEGHREIRYSH